MKYRLQFLKKENDLNKILSQQKVTKTNMSILFVSEWDRWCQNLTYELKKKYDGTEDGEKLYVVRGKAVCCKQLRYAAQLCYLWKHQSAAPCSVEEGQG
jgi:hypothetical protein